MAGMERWLNTRAALVTAWVVVFMLALGAAGFALYLLWPMAVGEDADAAARSTAAPTATRATPVTAARTIFTGTLERVDGLALVVNVSGSEPARVLVRQGAAVGLVAVTGTGDIRAGEPVTLRISRQPDGRLMALQVRLQPPEVPAGSQGLEPRTTGAGVEPVFLIGTVAAVEGERLRVRTARGEQVVDLPANVRVLRFIAVAPAELRPGQRVTVEAEPLVDGTLAAFSVQVFEQR
jgi:hypothetical protein